MRYGKIQPVGLADGTDTPVGDETLTAVAGALLGLAATWVAAGSSGLFAHPLRRAIALLLVTAAILAHRTCPGGRSRARFLILSSAFAAGRA